MGLITINPESDGTSADANDLNSRFAIVTGVINGNIDSANIKSGGVSTANIATSAITNDKLADGSIAFIKLLSTVFSGEIVSSTNAGSAGGTINQLNLGGLKICWGTTANKTHNAGASGNYNISFPASFFTATPSAVCSIQAASGSVISNNIVGVSISTTTYTLGWANETGSAGVGGTAAWVAIGV